MPEYSHIQTYIKCNKDEFPYKVNSFVEAISPLGFNRPKLIEDFSQLEWEVADDGVVYVGGGANTQILSIRNEKLNVRPYLMGWTSEVIPKLDETWLEICLLLHTEEIEEDFSSGLLKSPMKPVIWMLLTHISHYFSEAGTFFTNEATNGVPWESLISHGEGIWSFDAAIIPKHLFDKYSKIDEEVFFWKMEKEKLWLARKAVWTNEPWLLS